MSVAQVTVQFPHQERGSKDSLWGSADETALPLVKKNVNNFKTVTANNPTKCKTLLSVGTCVTTTHVTCPWTQLYQEYSTDCSSVQGLSNGLFGIIYALLSTLWVSNSVKKVQSCLFSLTTTHSIFSGTRVKNFLLFLQ